MKYKEAFIIVDRLDVIGGVQLVTLSIARVLIEEGLYNTVIISYFGAINNKLILTIIPQYIMRYIRFRPLLKLQRLPVTLKYLYLLNANKLYDIKESYDIVINAHGDIIPINGDVIYFHQFNVDYNYFQEAELINRLKVTPIWLLRRRFLNSIRDKLIIVNSNWTMIEARKFWKLNNINVIYPPVMIEKYLNCQLHDRKNLVITISRFSKDRQLENILYIAKKIKDAKFIIAGFVQDAEYFSKLLKNAPSNTIFIPNIDEERKRELLCKAKVYVNPTLFIEGFGMSVIEGMAAGLIPIAVDKGGIKDTVPPSWRFKNLEQAIRLVELALNSWTPQYGLTFRELSKNFSYDVFKNKLIKLINK